MTTVAPHVVSAISGGAYEPWQCAASVAEQHEIVDRLLSQPAGHVLFYVWDRPVDAGQGKFPAQQLKVVYNDGYGAAHFTNSDPDHGLVGAWLTRASTPLAPASPLAYDPWNPDETYLPTEALLPVERLREIAAEYAATGHQPACVEWTAVEFV